jgi:hypothetical protein
MRILVRIGAVLLFLYGALVVGLAIAMHQPPSVFGSIMAKMPPAAFMVLPFERLWMRARAGDVHVGGEAPDFSLKSLNGDASVQLSSFRRHKPVVLVFGSYT